MISQHLFPWRHKEWSLKADIIAGFIVAILIIPQAIGYGLLANLPATSALACCIFPLIAYALFGNGRALAIGPVAIVSLMVGDALMDIPNADKVAGAQLLALQVALILFSLRVLKLANLVHFIGHPVIHGFTSAAAIIIIVKQIPLILGLKAFTLTPPNMISVALGLAALLLLLLVSRLPNPTLSKLGPLFAIALGIMASFFLPEHTLSQVNIAADSPAIVFTRQLPWQYFNILLPSAALIALIGFLESTSVAKILARKYKDNINANQEILGLSFANLSAALFQAYPVAGGFGRSMVNEQAGATSPLAGIFTALFVLVFLLFARPIIAFIPITILGAIVIMAVWKLIDLKPLFKNWAIYPKDNIIWLSSFIGVLAISPDMGIAAGVVVSLFFLIRSASTPHMAIIGRIPNSAHFRNVNRHHVETHKPLLAIRIDEGLHFANKEAVNHFLEKAIKSHPHAQHVLIVCSAVNIIDAEGIELLEIWSEKLQSQGRQLHLSEVKGPIMDTFEKINFKQTLSPGKIFLSTHQAFNELCTGPEYDI